MSNKMIITIKPIMNPFLASFRSAKKTKCSYMTNNGVHGRYCWWFLFNILVLNTVSHRTVKC